MRKALLYSNESVHILEGEEEKFQESFSCGGEGEGARPQDSSLSGARDVDEIKNTSCSEILKDTVVFQKGCIQQCTVQGTERYKIEF